MIEPQPHQMLMETTHPSGDEEWYCPTCGRRFLVRWQPRYKKVVLEPGDEYAIHSGGRGGLRMTLARMDTTGEPALSDEMRAALENALKDVDLDDD